MTTYWQKAQRLDPLDWNVVDGMVNDGVSIRDSVEIMYDITSKVNGWH